MVLSHRFFENGSANAGYQLGRKKIFFIILPNKQSIDTQLYHYDCIIMYYVASGNIQNNMEVGKENITKRTKEMIQKRSMEIEMATQT